MDITLKSDIDVELLGNFGSDLDICKAAKVCTYCEDAADLTSEKQEGLIKYLVKHRHGSPFEHGYMRFYVYAPIFVWREWHRHRIGFSYNEESGRYTRLAPVFYNSSLHRPLMKVEDWKAGRPKFTVDGSSSILTQVNSNLIKSYELAYEMYVENLRLNVDPGLARDCLPVGVYSRCWVSCNPRSLMNFLSLRVHDPTATFVSYPLYEIDMAARQLEEHFARLYPITHKAFCDNGRVAP